MRYLRLAVLLLGLVVDVDYDRRTVVLETSAGVQRLSIAADAIIVDHAARPLAFRDLARGDAVAYRGAPERVTGLSVARHFWALPPED